MLKIITAPNPVLSEISKPLSKVNVSVIKVIEEMKRVLAKTTDPKGVGLAAPQVGKSLQIFLAKPSLKSPIQVFINPRIIQKTKISHLTIDSGRIQLLNASSSKKSQASKLEGCLSLPNIWGEVKRNPSVKISYMDEKGKKYSKEFKGFIATIVQHELDHLQGILFPKRVLEQKGTLYKSSKNKKGEDEFEEIEI